MKPFSDLNERQKRNKLAEYKLFDRPVRYVAKLF